MDRVVDYAIFMLDVNGRVATWNSGAEKIKGYAAEEIIGKHFSTFYPAADITAGKPDKELSVAVELGRVEDEGWRIRKDGTHFWASVVITALRDDAGKLRGFGKVTRDLTARHKSEETERALIRERVSREVAEQAERRVRESEERYRALSQRLQVVLEGVGDGITAQDRSGRVLFANGAAARICGYDSPEALMRAPPADVVDRFEMHDAEGQLLAADDLPARRVLAGEPSADAVLHVRERATRRDSWVQLRSSAVIGVDGTPEIAVNIWHDVTAEHREERQRGYLADAAAALGSSLDAGEVLSSAAGILVPHFADWCAIYVTEDNQLRTASVAHADPEKRAMALELGAKYPPRPDSEAGVWHVVRTGQTVVLNDVDDQLLQASAQSPEHLAALRAVGMKAALIVPIRAGRRVLGAIALVSAEGDQRYDADDEALAVEVGRRVGVALENARLYSAAQVAAQRAEEASRAKDEFLATVSHELRTPLAAILGWSTLLKDRVTDPAAVKPIAVIHRNAQAQVKIIDDILDVSRVITGKLRIETRAVDLAAIVRDALEVVRPSADAKRIKLELIAHCEVCPLVADPERLQQVAWNLLSNAVKFTDPGGTVTVSVAQEQSQVVLVVRDTGKGIEPEFLPLVFDRFRQADSSTTRRVGGLGLGLALVRHIVELHGGRARAASEGLGKGTTMTITLPIQAVAVTAVERPPELAPKATSGATSLIGIRVLVVDDEADAREVVAAVLLDAGAEVDTAGCAAEGFQAFKRFRPDVLVSDIGMPDEDGHSFIRRIRALSTAEGGRIPSLALTAFAREEDRSRAIGSGFTTHIGKPVNPDALISAVANLWNVRARG